MKLLPMVAFDTIFTTNHFIVTSTYGYGLRETGIVHHSYSPVHNSENQLTNILYHNKVKIARALRTFVLCICKIFFVFQIYCADFSVFKMMSPIVAARR